jgi:hypothetical protein
MSPTSRIVPGVPPCSPRQRLNYLTDDDLPSEILSSDVALRQIEEFLRQNRQDPVSNSWSDDPSDSA